MVGLFLLGAISVPVLSRSDRTSDDLGERTVRRVEVSSERGAVRVRTGPPRVDARRTWILSAPEVRHTVEDGVLRVDVTCPAWAFVSCSADVDVQAPAEAAVRVRAVEGDVTVEGVRGVTDIESEDGAVEVREARAQRVLARSITGSVRVAAERAPTLLQARSETGTVTVEVPSGPYRLRVDSGQGREVVRGVRSDPDAARRLEASSGLRDVTVTGR